MFREEFNYLSSFSLPLYYFGPIHFSFGVSLKSPWAAPQTVKSKKLNWLGDLEIFLIFIVRTDSSDNVSSRL